MTTTETEPEIGQVLKLTATAYIPGFEPPLFNNRDALWALGGGVPVYYGIRATIPGTNGYEHVWLGPLLWWGVTCNTQQCENNSVITWVYLGRDGAAAAELMKKHPNEFGTSR